MYRIDVCFMPVQPANESTVPYWANLHGLRMLTNLSEAIFHLTSAKRQ